MRIDKNIKTFLHTFFILKTVDYYKSNKTIINSFKKKPGLYHIAKKEQIKVEEVYNIIKTHDINVLNTNIIKLMESR
jgi:hypothetical protein